MDFYLTFLNYYYWLNLGFFPPNSQIDFVCCCLCIYKGQRTLPFKWKCPRLISWYLNSPRGTRKESLTICRNLHFSGKQKQEANGKHSATKKWRNSIPMLCSQNVSLKTDDIYDKYSFVFQQITLSSIRHAATQENNKVVAACHFRHYSFSPEDYSPAVLLFNSIVPVFSRWRSVCCLQKDHTHAYPNHSRQTLAEYLQWYRLVFTSKLVYKHNSKFFLDRILGRGLLIWTRMLLYKCELQNVSATCNPPPPRRYGLVQSSSFWLAWVRVYIQPHCGVHRHTRICGNGVNEGVFWTGYSKGRYD